jgi:nucleoside-diphosphate-sugar epimerase
MGQIFSQTFRKAKPKRKYLILSNVRLFTSMLIKFSVLTEGADAFAATLRATLLVNTSDDDLMISHSSEIGIDSLVSVNIRSWFLKCLQVSIPVLKIMSNETMGNLVRLAVDLIPLELVPQLHASSDKVKEFSDSQPNLSIDINNLKPVSSKGTASLLIDGGLDSVPELDHGYFTNSKVTAKIDWAVEIFQPADLIDIPYASDLPPPLMPPAVIVLTGVSGLFGHHLLEYLLKQTSIQRIICIAVRNLSTRLDKGELAQPSSRVEYHEGDLSAPLLGLSPAEAVSVFNTADAVIHNGADTSHMKGYFDLRATNVGSTITLARLCLRRRIPMHYVSSAGLAILHGCEAFPPESIAGTALPASDGSFGYVSSKWTCERLLEQTHKLYGGAWTVCIHRPSTIIREGEDAVGIRAELDWVNALLRYARKTKTVPLIRDNHGALDLVRVQSACTELVAHVMHADARSLSGEVSYVHEVGDMVLPLNRLKDIGLQGLDGKSFIEIPLDEWIAQAIAQGMHPAVATLIEMMDKDSGGAYPRLLKHVSTACSI